MQKNKDINGLLGPWKDSSVAEKFKGQKTHKFLKRDRTLKINWKRLHNLVPYHLLDEKQNKVLDVASGNGATLEIFRHYNHKIQGLDYTPHMDKGEWLYKPLLESQNIPCVVHNGSILPYPFKDKEFDLVICFGAITFFKPIEDWGKILDEFARLSKKTILIGVNKGEPFNKGRKYLDNWENPDFKLVSCQGHIYKWTAK